MTLNTDSTSAQTISLYNYLCYIGLLDMGDTGLEPVTPCV
jgi:hypothetical protein